MGLWGGQVGLEKHRKKAFTRKEFYKDGKQKFFIFSSSCKHRLVSYVQSYERRRSTIPFSNV